MENYEVTQVLSGGKNVLIGMKNSMQTLLEAATQVKDLDIENADIKETLDTISDDVKSKISELMDEIDSVSH